MDNTPEQESVTNSPGTEEKKSDSKKWIIIAVLVIVVLYALSAMFSPERAIERMMEQASDGEYDVDLGRDGKMKVTGEKGEEMNIATGKSATLPDGWPASIPLMSDAKIESSAAVNGGADEGTNLMVSYQTAKDVAAVVAFYKEELAANGWTIESTIDVGEGSMISASGANNEVLVINAANSDGATTVVVTTQLEG